MKQSFQESDRAGKEEALHKLLRTTGNLAFVPLAAALAGSTVMTSRVRIRLWHAFLLTHLVHVTALIALRQQHSRSQNAFSLVSKMVGPLGYAVVATLTLAQLPPGPPPKRGWRRPGRGFSGNARRGRWPGVRRGR